MGRKRKNQEPSEEELLLQSLGSPRPVTEKPVVHEAPPEPEAEPVLSLREQLEASMNSLGSGERTPNSGRGAKNTKRGRVDIIRQTAHRGGKGVTVVKNFTGISADEKQALAKKMQKACGAGGTVKDGCIEIQGENREEVKRILLEAGFNPVFAGG